MGSFGSGSGPGLVPGVLGDGLDVSASLEPGPDHGPFAGRSVALDGAESDDHAGPGWGGLRRDRLRAWVCTRRGSGIVGLIVVAVLSDLDGLTFVSIVTSYYAFALIVLGPGVRDRLPAVGGGFTGSGVRRLAVPRVVPGARRVRAAHALRKGLPWKVT